MDVTRWFLAGMIVVKAASTGYAGLEQDPLPENTRPESAVVSAPVVQTPQSTMDRAAEQNEAGVAAADVLPSASTEAAPEIEAQPVPHHRPLSLFSALGKSDGDVVAVMIGADYHFDQRLPLGENGNVSPFGEFLLSYWEGEKGHTGIESLHEAGASVLLRYRYLQNPHADVRPYVDLGLGMHYLTETAIEGKELGRHWQAGSNIGIGLMFPRNERFEVGIRVRHLSNAGTEDKNWGVNQVLGRVAFRF